MIQRATWNRRHPHQVLIAGMCVVSGLPILFGGPRPGSLSASLPLPLLYLWAVVLIFGGSLIVSAAIVQSVTLALYLELVADLPVAITALVYAVSIIVFAGPAGIPPAAIVTGASVAFAVRFFQAWRTVRDLRRRLSEVQ